MTEWNPHNDLARLLEALSQEIIAASENEVRRACSEDVRSAKAAVREVRGLVGAEVGDNGGEIGAGLPPAEIVKSREHRQRH
jgi:hypothetical protein